MDSKRAEEIMQSHGVIKVSYNGMPVWIESIRGELAEISLIGVEKRMDVPVNSLTEGDTFKSI